MHNMDTLDVDASLIYNVAMNYLIIVFCGNEDEI